MTKGYWGLVGIEVMIRGCDVIALLVVLEMMLNQVVMVGRGRVGCDGVLSVSSGNTPRGSAVCGGGGGRVVVVVVLLLVSWWYYL